MPKKIYTTEEKERFSAEAKAKAKAAEELLKAGVREMYTSGRYAEYLKFYSGFHDYSFRNCILIMTQFPAATICASYIDWKKKGRQVKRGECGIMVRVPTPVKYKTEKENGTEEEHSIMRFKVGSVFDISQTVPIPGKNGGIPEICHKLTGDVAEYHKVCDSIKKVSNVPISIEEIKDAKNGFYNKVENKIVVKEGMPQAQTIKTMVHEVAHSILHCPGGVMENAERPLKELQAESVAYIVCNYLGIDSGDYSFGYVTSWCAGKTERELDNNIAVIGKCAQDIIKAIAEA